MTKSYEFYHSKDISKIATDKVVKYLSSLEETTDIINVEEDRDFQLLDIDLIQVSKEEVVNIEVKCDTYKTGNFFFETISNLEKGTKGCFMYTSADYIYYYFIPTNELYILPMPATRLWFIRNKERFKERKLATRDKSKELYTTLGCTVPIKLVMKDVKDVRRIIL